MLCAIPTVILLRAGQDGCDAGQGRLDSGIKRRLVSASQAYGIPFSPVGDRSPALAESLQVIKADRAVTPPTLRSTWTAPPAIRRRCNGPLSSAVAEATGSSARRQACPGPERASVPPQQVTPTAGFHQAEAAARDPGHAVTVGRCCWHPPSPARKNWIREEFASIPELAHRRDTRQVRRVFRIPGPRCRPFSSRFHTAEVSRLSAHHRSDIIPRVKTEVTIP